MKKEQIIEILKLMKEILEDDSQENNYEE
jgi:hypothetical protein